MLSAVLLLNYRLKNLTTTNVDLSFNPLEH